MLIYLSGPMTGISNFNYPAFDAAAQTLRSLGFEVMNPAEFFNGQTGLPKTVYMKKDIAAILQAEAVLLLAGWRESAGARMEILVAQACGIPIYELEEMFGK